jgi:putative ABC transport system permease protein
MAGGNLLLKDFRHAARGLAKRPGFTFIVAITLMLGIGASTAIFSVTNAVLLRPLPYKDPGRLAVACYDMRKRNVRDFPFSNVNYIDLRKGATATFEDIAAVRTGRGVVPAADGTPEQVRVGVVSVNFFRLMGARVALGRDFTDEDGLVQAAPQAAPGAPAAAPAVPQMVILSYPYWQRHYGGDPRVLSGLNNPKGTRIVGVLEPGFELLFPPDANIEQRPDFWNAARIPYDPANRNNVQWRLIGRLKAGATMEQAQRDAERVADEIRKADIIGNTAGAYIRIVPMKDHLVEGVQSTVMALMGAVVLLVVIACANVANLLLVRMSLRERELAVRAAIGGSAWDLARQALAEALLLAALGATLGAALAWAGVRELLAIAPASLPRLNAVRIDATVLGFTVVAGLVSAAMFGLAPVVRAAKPDLMDLLRGGSRNAGLNRAGLLRSGVVVAEVALSFVLLIASGLMIRTFVALRHVQPGYDAHNLLTFQLLGGRPLQDPAARAASQRQIETRLASITGVESVTATFPLPLTGNFSPIRWGLQEALTDPSRFQATDFQFVLPGYFKAMRTPILAGREFTDADNQPGRKMVIIDENLAAKAFPGRPAVGEKILARVNTPQPDWFEVIGVAAHERNTDLGVIGREQIYFADAYVGSFANRWALRTQGDPGTYAAAVREGIRKQDPTFLIAELQPMQEWVERSMAGTRFSLLLIGIFAAIAAVLAAVGLYGVLSTVVRQRRVEIGVRMALGAAPGGILGLVVGYGLRLSAAGMAIGIVCAFATTRVMRTMLVGVRPEDPATFAAMAVLFTIIAGAASWLPARRAARLDPTAALRDE